MAEQRSGVNLSLPVPLSRHFDVMAALCFVMLKSCQISGPVTALSACLLGLTGPVMELRLNKRVTTFPVLDRSAFIQKKKGRRGLLSSMQRKEEEESMPPFCQDVSREKKPNQWVHFCISILHLDTLIHTETLQV